MYVVDCDFDDAVDVVQRERAVIHGLMPLVKMVKIVMWFSRRLCFSGGRNMQIRMSPIF